MTEIGRIITSSVDIGEVYERFAEHVRKLIPFDRIAIWMVDLQRENLVPSYVWGVDVPDLEQGKPFPLKGIELQAELSQRSAWTVQEGRVGALVPRFPGLLHGTSAALPAMLLVPLVSGNETVGMLSLRSTTPNAYSVRDVVMAERIGAQIAGAVANGRVYIEYRLVEESVREAVERLELAVKGSGDGLWDRKILEDEVWWSPRFKEMVGYSEVDEETGPQGGRPVCIQTTATGY